MALIFADLRRGHGAQHRIDMHQLEQYLKSLREIHHTGGATPETSNCGRFETLINEVDNLGGLVPSRERQTQGSSPFALRCPSRHRQAERRAARKADDRMPHTTEKEELFAIRWQLFLMRVQRLRIQVKGV